MTPRPSASTGGEDGTLVLASTAADLQRCVTMPAFGTTYNTSQGPDRAPDSTSAQNACEIRPLPREPQMPPRILAHPNPRGLHQAGSFILIPAQHARARPWLPARGCRGDAGDADRFLRPYPVRTRNAPGSDAGSSKFMSGEVRCAATCHARRVPWAGGRDCSNHPAVDDATRAEQVTEAKRSWAGRGTHDRRRPPHR